MVKNASNKLWIFIVFLALIGAIVFMLSDWAGAIPNRQDPLVIYDSEFTNPFTVEELKNRSDEVIGKSVRVTGVTKALTACTAIGCSPENPCCNNCGGNLQLYNIQSSPDTQIMLELRNSKNEPYVCGGNECSLSCEGDLLENRLYNLKGIVKKNEDGSDIYLEVTDSELEVTAD